MISVNHYSLVHKFIPMLQAMKIPDAKAAVVKEWEPPEKSRAWKLPKVRNTTSIDLCHLKNSGLELRHQKHKGKVVFRVDIVKDDSCANAVFIESGSSASQMTAAKVPWTLFQDYQDAQDKQHMQYPLTPRSKWKMHRRY